LWQPNSLSVCPLNVEPSKTTQAQFLEKWLDQIEPNVAPRTFERYQEIARKNLVPLLAQTIITKLRPEQIATAYSKARRRWRPLPSDRPPNRPRSQTGSSRRGAVDDFASQSSRDGGPAEGRAAQDDSA
jgi:Phage integrase, N-terminal SAM-like domain